MCRERTKQRKGQLFICPANDTIQGHSLTLRDRFAMAGAEQTKREEHGRLPDKLVMSVGMKVMVTFNVATDLDIANGSRGEIKAIILDDREQVLSRTYIIDTLSYLPVCVLIKSQNTKVPTLPGLDNGVIPNL
jgi:hypothetical protein